MLLQRCVPPCLFFLMLISLALSALRLCLLRSLFKRSVHLFQFSKLLVLLGVLWQRRSCQRRRLYANFVVNISKHAFISSIPVCFGQTPPRTNHEPRRRTRESPTDPRRFDVFIHVNETTSSVFPSHHVPTIHVPSTRGRQPQTPLFPRMCLMARRVTCNQKQRDTYYLQSLDSIVENLQHVTSSPSGAVVWESFGASKTAHGRWGGGFRLTGACARVRRQDGTPGWRGASYTLTITRAHTIVE